MGALLDAAIHPRQLHRAWQKVARNRGCSGGDGLTVTTVAARPFRYVRRLAADLREGSYRPGALRRVEIPNRSGGTRRLAIPCVLDRVAQTAVAMVLQPRLEREFEDASYGYRPGRSVNMAVERVSALQRQGFGWVVDADIDAFFDHVPQIGRAHV
jgi:CRISP-associated protein Cas1